jgi:hypothetical protein
MNDRYKHLFRKSGDANRGGHDAWAVQSSGEKVAVALVLNRADCWPRSGTPFPRLSSAAARSG